MAAIYFRDLLSQASITQVVLLGSALFVLSYNIFYVIYNLYFHPLADVPGPKLWAISRIPYNIHTLRGTAAVNFLELHKKYGQTVRYCPNGIVYSNYGAWDEIYGPYKHGQNTNAINAINGEHRRLKMRFMRALSAKAVSAQEPLILNYAQKLIAGMNRELLSPSHEGMINVAEWLSMATFDVIGDLAFSKSFGCLETGTLHPWIKVVFGAFKALPCLRVVREIPGVPYIGLKALYLLPRTIKQKWLDHFHYGADLIDKRIASGEDRPDMAHYLTSNEGLPLTLNEIKENAVQLLTAGSEPTATFSAGVFYFLTKNPPVYERLKTEIRSAFTYQDDITLAKLAQLDYLNRVVREGLRVFPPAADIFPRIIPEGGEVIMGKYLPEGTHVSIGAYAISRDERNFPDPDIFDPERWLPEHIATDARMKASQPFGQGHRSCIGKILAHAEVRLLVSSLILNYDFELLTVDQNWISGCKVYIGWEKIPLRFQTTASSQNQLRTSVEKHVVAFGDFKRETSIER
ncbi:cytochrome P450 [Mollisia scopiformis]|uniref:Cytochrome P450 n=1 Tax=Mollisia scopiformis TaxID=149040 RepID=A0A194XIP3_MOLSC|nr:cytochrome P450 [Mollisia scopiformis]KUJ19989.1 cytochrome P450 [Mollisia scopiformis]